MLSSLRPFWSQHVLSHIDKYKTRVVAKGHKQLKGLDNDETFAPIVRF